MRKPKYLSNSALIWWEKDREEFYFRYLAENRPKRSPQVRPMAVGSAFDAFAKSYLHEAIFGKGADPKYEFQALFEEQVEPHNRDQALIDGQYVFDAYRTAGALDDLLAFLQEAKEAPRFEFRADRTIHGVPLMGKPDLAFVHKSNVRITHDWKVNGFYSRSATSPTKLYMLCRDGSGQNSRSHGTAHKDFKPLDFNGVKIHAGFMEEFEVEWADQTSAYGWLMGEKPGDEDVVTSIHQIVTKPGDPKLLRVAEYRARVSSAHQNRLLSRYTACWQAIESGHIFRELSRKQSDEKCAELDRRAASFVGASDLDAYFNTVARAS